jgi:hypothetical protein
MLPRLLDIFARFAAGRPDATLHLHTDPDDEFCRSAVYSYDVRADIRHLGLEAQVQFTPGFEMRNGAGLPPERLARYYQAADVHLLASTGEGFGLPTLQAAAAGVVPMAVAYSANPELIAGHGQAIPASDWLDNEFGIRRALIDVDAAARELRRYADDDELLLDHAGRARRFATSYGWPGVIEQWDTLLGSICQAPTGRLRPTLPEDRTVVRHVQPDGSGSRVTVTMLSRQLGQLESAIMADARQADSSLRVPSLPRACEVADVRVPRELGLVCVAPGDEGLLAALWDIFPLVHGFVPVANAPTDNLWPAAIEYVEFEDADDLRYRLAQAILLLDSSGTLPEAVLIDAALFGVPAVLGPSVGPSSLWPSLDAEAGCSPISRARSLMTNQAEAERASATCRLRCRNDHRPDEHAVAQSLRRLHRTELASAGTSS